MSRRPSVSAVCSAVQLDLRALSKEAKANPELKDAVERALLKLVYAEKSKSPFLLALASSHAPLVSASLAGLHRLVSHFAIHISWAPRIVSDCAALNFSSLESTAAIKMMQISVALSTQSAFNLHGEDLRLCLSLPLRASSILKDAQIPGIALSSFRQALLGTCARLLDALTDAEDARIAVVDLQRIVNDLLKVAGGDNAPWLACDGLTRDLSLELLNDLISENSDSLRSLDEYSTNNDSSVQATRVASAEHALAALLAQSLPVLLDRLYRTRRIFPVMVRVLRLTITLAQVLPSILFAHPKALLKRVAVLLEVENAVWLRAVALEALAALFALPHFVLLLFQRLPNKSGEENVFEQIIHRIGRFVKAQLAGEQSALFLAHPNADIKCRCLDLLDRTSEPADVKAAYLVSQGVLCLTSLVDSLGILLQDDQSPDNFDVCRALADQAWPSVLAALSHALSSTADEQLMQLILKAYSSFTHSCAQLGLWVSRDAFLTSMKKIALPSEQKEPTSASFASRLSGFLTSSHASPSKNTPMLTSRNIQTMKRLVNMAYTAGNSLGGAWEIVLDALEVLHGILYSGSSIEDAVSDELSRDELHALAGALVSLFSTSTALTDAALIQLIENLDKRARARLFPSRAEEVEQLEVASKQFVYANVTFSLLKLMEVVEVNMDRVAMFWDIINDLLAMVCNHGNIHVRAHGAHAMAKIAESGLKDDGSGKLELSFLTSMKTLAASPYEDVREVAMEQIYNILQICGHHLTVGWPFVLSTLKLAVSNGGKFEPRPKQVAKAFASLQYICTDFLAALPVPALEPLVATIAAFGSPVYGGDINVAITSVGGLLWNVSDFLAASKEMHAPTRSALWLTLIDHLRTLALSERNEIRTAALRALFGILGTHGAHLQDEDWPLVLPRLYDLLDDIAAAALEAPDGEPLREHRLGRQEGQDVMMLVHHTRNSAGKQWNETRVIALEGVLRVFKGYVPVFSRTTDMRSVWERLLEYITLYWDNSNIEVALAGMKAVETMLIASADMPSYPSELWEKGWQSYLKMSTTLSKKEAKVSHTTINTFNASIRKLYDKLSPRFTLKDVEVFLDIIRPLPILPVEYAGELSMLHSNAMEMLETFVRQWSESVPTVIDLLLEYVSHVIGYSYATIAPLHKKNVAKECDEKGARSRNVNLNFVSLGEKALKALSRILATHRLSPHIFDAVVRVLGRTTQLRKIDVAAPLWVLAITSLSSVLERDTNRCLGEFETSDAEKQKTQRTELERTLVWTDIADTIEGFLLAKGTTSPQSTVAEQELDWCRHMAALTRHLAYFAPSNLQNRLIGILIECAGLEWDHALSTELSKNAFTELFKVIAATNNNIPENVTPLIAQHVAQRFFPLITDNIGALLKSVADQAAASSLLLKTQWMLAALSELRVNPAVVSRPSPRAHLFVLLPSVVPLVGRGGEDVQEGVRSLLSAIASELNS